MNRQWSLRTVPGSVQGQPGRPVSRCDNKGGHDRSDRQDIRLLHQSLSAKALQGKDVRPGQKGSSGSRGSGLLSDRAKPEDHQVLAAYRRSEGSFIIADTIEQKKTICIVDHLLQNGWLSCTLRFNYFLCLLDGEGIN